MKKETYGLWQCFECINSNECWTIEHCREFRLDRTLTKKEIEKRGRLQNAIYDFIKFKDKVKLQ